MHKKRWTLVIALFALGSVRKVNSWGFSDEELHSEEGLNNVVADPTTTEVHSPELGPTTLETNFVDDIVATSTNEPHTTIVSSTEHDNIVTTERSTDDSLTVKSSQTEQTAITTATATSLFDADHKNEQIDETITQNSIDHRESTTVISDVHAFRMTTENLGIILTSTDDNDKDGLNYNNIDTNDTYWDDNLGSSEGGEEGMAFQENGLTTEAPKYFDKIESATEVKDFDSVELTTTMEYSDSRYDEEGEITTTENSEDLKSEGIVSTEEFSSKNEDITIAMESLEEVTSETSNWENLENKVASTMIPEKNENDGKIENSDSIENFSTEESPLVLSSSITPNSSAIEESVNDNSVENFEKIPAFIDTGISENIMSHNTTKKLDQVKEILTRNADVLHTTPSVAEKSRLDVTFDKNENKDELMQVTEAPITPYVAKEEKISKVGDIKTKCSSYCSSLKNENELMEGFQQCQKGEKGDSGPIGPRGLRGPKGIKGSRGGRGRMGKKGDTGSQGERGPPGLSIVGQKGEPGESFDFIFPRISGPPGPKGAPGLAGLPGLDGLPGMGMLSFKTQKEMIKHKPGKLGSIAYCEEQDRFYGKTKRGWFPLQLQEFPAPQNKDFVKSPSEFEPFDKDYLSIHSEIIPVVETIVHPIVKKNPKKRSHRGHLKYNKSKGLKLIALNDPYTGNGGGIDEINYKCQQEANAVEMDGIFRAFLSSRHEDLFTIVKSKDSYLPIVNSKGHILFHSWDRVFDTPLNRNIVIDESAAIYSFDGKNVIWDTHWDVNMVWHGSYPNGSHNINFSCNDWRSESDLRYGLASDMLHEDGLLNQKKISCDSKLIVLCIEIRPFHRVSSIGSGSNNANRHNTVDSFDQHFSVIENYDNLLK